MFKITTCALAAALLAAPAFAQAVPVDVELEGLLQSFDPATRSLVVMGMEVEVPSTTTIHSPAATRQETGLGHNAWFRGAILPGRNRAGFLGGTAIVLGTWDPVAGKIIASDISTEPSENVALGVITGSWCSTQNCDGEIDFLRGNTAVGGAPGPAMLPIRDVRMAASPVGDEGGFPLDLTGVNMNGIPYVAEGYYGNVAVPVGTGTTGSTLSELAFHYFKLDLANYFPQYYLNKGAREISLIRTDCREGERFEVTGHIHTRVTAGGVRNDALAANSGVVEVQYMQGTTFIRRSAVAVPIAANSPIGRYRVRFDVPGACPSQVAVRWMPVAGGAVSAAYASTVAQVEIRAD